MHKLFLVEDEALIRSGLKHLIEEVIGGFQVVGEAENGRLALEALKSVKPDVLITDIRMNEMNGLEMIRRVRDQYPDLYILILSGYADFEYAKQAIKYGISDYLLKPVDRTELAQALGDYRRKYGTRSSQADQPEEGGTDLKGRQLIRKVKELVAQRLDQEISLQYMAEQVHLNHQYLSVLFKSETGQNFTDYVSECRMNRAKQLLKETNLKIYEVAKLSGYLSSKHFMAVFKDYTGSTPTQYREQL
ncbi:response regulator transcription factor [Paenibacillus borealis]|uniref:AraC family transcriptional regulator n=1 Tax=Paenibacillus borealis TaxID=160799 RepID=A0A089LEA8_PAEBO|nr:response regulator [Paenibacillus borealis]AIQ57468.1 AraC family transcriptional regulator [Paenibacillus borealis]